MRLETFARAGLPLQIEFFVDLFGAEVLEDGAPCGDRSERVRDSWCNREQRVRYVTSERSTASTRSVLAQSPGGEAAWAHCPAEAVRTPLVWLRRADASDESARTQRDFDVTTQNQLAYKACRRWREVSARPDATPPLNILGYNTLTNTLLVTRHIRSRRIPPVCSVTLRPQDVGRGHGFDECARRGGEFPVRGGPRVRL
jgi:hypothetical protein